MGDVIIALNGDSLEDVAPTEFYSRLATAPRPLNLSLRLDERGDATDGPRLLSLALGPGKLGIAMGRSNSTSYVEVKGLRGQAAAMGVLRVGDHIVALNGMSLAGTSPADVQGMLTATPRPLNLRFLLVGTGGGGPGT